MKHLALALSILGFSSLSSAGLPEASPQDVVKKAETQSSDVQTDAKLKTQDVVQDKKMSVEEIKQRKAQKIQKNRRAAEATTKKRVKAL